MNRPKIVVAAGLLALSTSAFASEGALPFSFKPDTANQPSLQRGAADFMAYCSGCHGLKYLRWNRLGKDLGISEELLKANLMPEGAKPGDHIVSSMPKGSADPTKPAEPEQWFGRAPPDLSLTARSRGADWVYSYLLTFYVDPSKATGVNNVVLPGASMPHVLGGLQGYQVLEHAEGAAEGHGGGHQGPKLTLATKGSLSPAQYRELVGDITNFLVYAAEPGRNHRMAIGVGALIFCVIFGFFAYLLKAEYWKDVH